MERHTGPTERSERLVRLGSSPLTVFSRLEWVVIDFSRNDSLSSLAEPGPARRFLMQMIGMRGSAPLAAPRLEALRRMAVALRAEHEDHVILEEARFYSAGYQASDLVHLTSIIDADRGSVGPRRH